MSGKIKKLINYLLYIIWSNTIYGLALYSAVTRVARESLLGAYFINIGLIIFGLVMDELIVRKFFTPKKIISDYEKTKTEKEKRFYRLQTRFMTHNFVSFKSSLYLFYILVLILSQVINFDPSLVGQDMANFIQTTDYSIILLVGLDDFGGQFFRDRERMKQCTEELEDYWANNSDEEC
ncbi:MAG: hypothetical protein LBV33_05060 [Lachnospiraceae bacterium]|jgi:L-lactate permease|nr:hypothetical protein [Lachnospiraceae bacterium]